MPTVSAGGTHAATVYAFLQKYYGVEDQAQRADEPAHTVTTKPRHGIVTVTVAGAPFLIVDIGMWMLTARKRFQGFRPDDVIDQGILKEAHGSTSRSSSKAGCAATRSARPRPGAGACELPDRATWCGQKTPSSPSRCSSRQQNEHRPGK